MKLPSWLDREAYPFRPRLVTVGEGAVSYLDEGAGEPFLFLHGPGSWSFLWRHMVKCAREKVRCLVPDLPGSGFSGEGEGADPAWIAAFLDRLGLEKVHLLLHGGAVPPGLEFAARYPERVNGVVAVNGSPVPFALPFRYRLARFFTRTPARYFHCFVEKTAGRPLGGPIREHYLAGMGTTGWKRGLASLGKGPEKLPSDTPLFVLLGGEDPLLPGGTEAAWKRMFPGAEVRTVGGGGHWLPETEGARLCVYVSRFLEDQAANAKTV